VDSIGTQVALTEGMWIPLVDAWPLPPNVTKAEFKALAGAKAETPATRETPASPRVREFPLDGLNGALAQIRDPHRRRRQAES
jgi:hypothetical protein